MRGPKAPTTLGVEDDLMLGKSVRVNPGERGSAMVIAILVTVILTLLGVSFMLMAETENKIAENERYAAQALFAAETGVRQVKRWFDRPIADGSSGKNVFNPIDAAIDRSLRIIDPDGDGPTASFPQNGTTGAPMYKQGLVLANQGGPFDRPFRPNLDDMLLGTEAGPDMRISEATVAGKTFLTNLSAALFGDFPGQGLVARINTIDIYSAPYLDLNGNWTRYGMGTVKVTARIYNVVGGGEVMVAEKMVKAVLNELPYPGPFGPLHSCDAMEYNGDFDVHWGAASAVGDADLTNNHQKISSSLPRLEPPGMRIDLLWGYDPIANSTADFDDYVAELYAANEEIGDPWFRYLAGGVIDGEDPTVTQPLPFNWTIGDSLGAGTYPNHDHGGDDGTHSNLFHRMPVVVCPEMPYEIWKEIATSGDSDVHYYVWDNGTSFKENGVGAAQTFRDITDNTGNNEGLFFFDTRDSTPPRDDDLDGTFDNLTPEISLQGGTWGARGFMYLNSVTFQSKGVTGRTTTFQPPGEPFLDIDQDGVFDGGEPWVNMTYPTALGDPFVADNTDTLQQDGTFGATVVRNSLGRAFTDDANMWGILYNNGEFEATGNAVYYGSVIAKSGVGENSPAAGTPDFYWDESLKDNWPPADWDLPRVVVTRWETDN